MKKVYAMTALALAVGLSASAMPMTVDQKLQTANAEAIVTVAPVGTGVAVSPVMASAPAKAVSSTEDLEGLKQWNGILVFGQKIHSGVVINGPQTGVSFAENAKKDRIDIANFPSTDLSLRLDVDLAKKEVSFQNGVYVGELNLGNGQFKAVNIYVIKNNGDIVLDESDGLYRFSGQPEACGAEEIVTGKILDDGSISFEGYTMMAQSPDMVEEGSVYLMLNTANIVFKPTPWNTPVEAEYNYVGLGEYKDVYFAPLFEDPSIIPANKKAEIYTKNVGNDLMIAVKNPYKNVEATLTIDGETIETNDFWKEAAQLMAPDASGDGWVLFQVMGSDMFKDYPGVTAILQMVPSGMEVDLSEEKDGSDLVMYYLFNAEGDALYGSGDESLLMLLEGWAAGTTQTKYEYTKMEDNVITIHNTALFGRGKDPAGGYWWNGGTRVEGGVTMPNGWTMGVNDIVNDSENAPVKYYNLQGMELSAPVKGQLTIMKQGKKSIKFIAR